MIIRMLNISSVAVVYFGYLYSFSYREKIKSSSEVCFRYILLCFLGLQLLIYDSYVGYRMYLWAYPTFVSLEEIAAIRKIIHSATVSLNMGVILFGMFRLCVAYRKVYYLQFLRTYLIGEGVCYILIMLSYILMFWFSPTFLVKVSKIADYTTYLSVPLSSNEIIYTAYPYYLLVTTFLCAFCIYEIMSVRRKMREKTFTITKQIDAADTTSKTFCHYMKNELLAIQSEIELLTVTEENKEGIEDLLLRCDNLYRRLDIIHRSTKHSELNLVETDMREFLEQMLERMKSEFRNVTLEVKMEEEVPKVMIDENYFEQAIKNIIENGIDAMEKVPKEERKLVIGLTAINNWIILSVQDCGMGIKKANMKHIFTPLYSSKPIKTHWGIGLALTHRIVIAHDGKIEVESREEMGTTFRILLPDLNQYVS